MLPFLNSFKFHQQSLESTIKTLEVIDPGKYCLPELNTCTSAISENVFPKVSHTLEVAIVYLKVKEVLGISGNICLA